MIRRWYEAHLEHPAYGPEFMHRALCILRLFYIIHTVHVHPLSAFFFLHSLIFNDTACLIIIAIICVLCLTADKCVKMNNWLEYGSRHSLAAAWTELNSRCEMPDQCRMAVNKRVTALFASVLSSSLLSIKSSCLRKWDGQIDRPLSQADLSNGLIFKALKVCVFKRSCVSRLSVMRKISLLLLVLATVFINSVLKLAEHTGHPLSPPPLFSFYSSSHRSCTDLLRKKIDSIHQ